MMRKLAAAFVGAVLLAGTVSPAIADDPPQTLTVPSPPENVVAIDEEVGADYLIVYWQPSQSDGGSPIESYEATLSPGGNMCETVAYTEVMRCGFTGLESNRTYTVTVTARNAMGLSLPSAPSDPVMLWGLPKIASVKSGNRKARVRWISAVDSSVTGFTVRQVGGRHSCNAPVSNRSCVVWGLKNGRKYRFKVSVQSGLNVIVTSKPSGIVSPNRIKK